MRMKRLLNSPGSKRKSGSYKHTFAVPLTELMRRAPPDAKVPVIISRLCDYLSNNALEHEGLFRISGNVRIVDKLRVSIDRTGDADLSEDGDIMAIAGLLKLFLRELPDGVIPQSMTQQFVDVEQEYGGDNEVFLENFLKLINNLPRENYHLLKYLTHFLLTVTQYEHSNKMGAMALAIIFGPNLFRCGHGLLGLQNQGISNKLVYRLIINCAELFGLPKKDNHLNHKFITVVEGSGDKKTPPPRPPPPKFAPPVNISATLPTLQESKDTIPMPASPRAGEEDVMGRVSPFGLDSDAGQSLMDSPVVPAGKVHLVDKMINKAISEHIFGDTDSSISGTNGDQSLIETHSFEDSSVVEGLNSDQPTPVPSISTSPASVSPTHTVTTSASGCHQHGPGSVVGNSHPQHSIYSLEEQSAKILNDETLSSTQNKSVSNHVTSVGATTTMMSLSSLTNALLPPSRTVPITQAWMQEPHIMIPPLDLSTLHEQVDDQEPVLSSEWGTGQKELVVNQAEPVKTVSSVSLEGMVSPRSRHLSGSNPVTIDTDMPPSPPIQQDQYIRHSDRWVGEEFNNSSSSVNSLTRKIQTLKKRLKNCEEGFEREHGHKPVPAEKASHPDMKLLILDLNKTKKELKHLKEKPVVEMSSNMTQQQHKEELSQKNGQINKPNIQHTLDLIQKRLSEKRREAGRPSDLSLMSYDQVLEEKLAVQKALLHFESIHGRPTVKEEKDLMRGLYDHYRKIKRLLVRPALQSHNADLVTVPEDQPIELQNNNKVVRLKSSIRVPTAGLDDGASDHDTQDFGIVTQNPGLLQDTVMMHCFPGEKVSPPLIMRRPLIETTLQENLWEDQKMSHRNSWESHLHQLSVRELQEELLQAQQTKKHLRKGLRQFEDEFLQKNGRKAQKSERGSRTDEYTEYKQVKAKLKLLEALLLKHHVQNT